MSEPRYASPPALRQAIDDRLKRFQREHPGTQLSDLQRQFAYDRLLSRVFRSEPDRWVLKGATAILARLGPQARHTRDVDLLSGRSDVDDAERALHAVASLDLDDHFHFALSPVRPLLEGNAARRLVVVAYLGTTVYASFHVDLVTGLELRAAPEQVDPLVPIDLPGLIRSRYAAWPLADHIADKVCAMLERHARQAGGSEPSTRYRDLADLALFAHTVDIDAGRLRAALGAEAARRRLDLPASLPDPEGKGWVAGYARVARATPGLEEKDLASALETVRRLVDPVLSSTATGSWRTEDLTWSD